MQTQNLQPKQWVLPQSMSPLKRRQASNRVLHAIYKCVCTYQYNTIRHHMTTYISKSPFLSVKMYATARYHKNLIRKRTNSNCTARSKRNNMNQHAFIDFPKQPEIWNTKESGGPVASVMKCKAGFRVNFPVQSLPLDHEDSMLTVALKVSVQPVSFWLVYFWLLLQYFCPLGILTLMLKKGWEKLEQKLEHAGTAGNDPLNFGLVSISNFFTYTVCAFLFFESFCSVAGRVQIAQFDDLYGLAGALLWDSPRKTIRHGEQLHFDVTWRLCFNSRDFKYAPSKFTLIDAFEEQCMSRYYTKHGTCCTCMLHIWTQLNRRMTCLLHLDKNLVANIQSVNVWSLNTWFSACKLTQWWIENPRFSSWPPWQMK